MEENINKKLQNKIPQSKIQGYQKSAIFRTRQLGYDIDNNGFDKGDIDRITKEIIDFCLKRWKI